MKIDQDSPFVGIESTANELVEAGCDTDIEKEIYLKNLVKISDTKFILSMDLNIQFKDVKYNF